MKDINSLGHPNNLNYGQWWDFTEQPNVSVFPLAAVSAGANANDDVAATLVGVIPRAMRLVGGYGVVSANSEGIDANNTSAWVVTVAGTTALTKTNVADLVADTPVSMGTPAITDMAAGSAVKLAITNGTNADLNSASCLVSLAVADQGAFPAPGLKVIASDGGTVTISDGAKGVCAISPGSADNNEIYLCTATEIVKLAAGKVWICEALIQFSEAATDDANICFGCSNGIAADELVDNAGGPKATGDYALIWKIDGGTVWRCGVQSNGTATPTTDADSTVTAGGTSYQRLMIKITCETSTRAIAEFFVDGENIGTHHFTYTSATEMAVVAGVKNGGAHAETLNLDYFGYEAVR
jgi:hypothetical protein